MNTFWSPVAFLAMIYLCAFGVNVFRCLLYLYRSFSMLVCRRMVIILQSSGFQLVHTCVRILYFSGSSWQGLVHGVKLGTVTRKPWPRRWQLSSELRGQDVTGSCITDSWAQGSIVARLALANSFKVCRRFRSTCGLVSIKTKRGIYSMHLDQIPVNALRNRLCRHHLQHHHLHHRHHHRRHENREPL